MRPFEKDLSKCLSGGLRKFRESPRNTQEMLVLHNLAPLDGGLWPHEDILDMGGSGITWGGQGQYTPTTISRSVTIRVTDYVDATELATVSVYLDTVLKGTTDANGELNIPGVTVGGHVLKLVKTGYLDSDDDTLFNDFIMVI